MKKKRKREIVVWVEGGLVQDVDGPPGFDVHVIDLDVEGVPTRELCKCKRSPDAHNHRRDYAERARQKAVTP